MLYWSAVKLKSNTPIKSLVLVLALSVTAIGAAQNAEAGPGGHGGFHGDFDHGRDFHGEYYWNHPYWHSHWFGYWHNQRGYWTYRHGEHVFIDID
jgi:hypothetical protein